MIFGIGIDIVEVKRVENMSSLDSFAKKILSNQEIEYFYTLDLSKQVKYLSIQYAGKEAIAKALGTGISDNVKFKEIEILRNEKGKPTLNALGQLKKYLTDLGINKTHVSLSDESNYSIAFAILEK